METVLGLVKNDALGAINDLCGLLLAPHGRQAIHKDCAGLGDLHRLGVHLVQGLGFRI